MTVAVLGIGNVLMGDDAVGPTVVRMLDALWDFPEGVVVEDIGTPAIELPSHLAGYDTVIFVDAVADDLPPGTIRVYNRGEILRYGPGLRVGPHDPAMKEALLMLDLAGIAPKTVVLVGIVAQETSMNLGLSPAVRSALPAALDRVLVELRNLGVEGRPASRPPALWWERAIA